MAQLLEDEAERDVGLAVEGAELAAGVELDDGEARIPDRDAAEVVGAVIRALGARRATGRALGRRPARRAQPPGAPFGVELPGARVLALRAFAGLLDDGAGATARQAVEDRSPAPGAEPVGAPFVVLLALRRLALVAARRAGRPALDRRLLAAADAEPRLAPDLLAALALEAAAPSLRFRVGAAVFQPAALPAA